MTRSRVAAMKSRIEGTVPNLDMILSRLTMEVGAGLRRVGIWGLAALGVLRMELRQARKARHGCRAGRRRNAVPRASVPRGRGRVPLSGPAGGWLNGRQLGRGRGWAAGARRLADHAEPATRRGSSGPWQSAHAPHASYATVTPRLRDWQGMHAGAPRSGRGDDRTALQVPAVKDPICPRPPRNRRPHRRAWMSGGTGPTDAGEAGP